MRNIKNGKFGWYEKEAMKKIETLPFKRQASCKLIYIAICSVSAKTQNSNNISCYKFDIARYSSVSEKTVQRYLKDLEDLQIIKTSPQDRKSNGKYEKIEISLLSNTLRMDTSETDERQMEDTESDTIKKERKKENIYKKEKFEFDFSHCLIDFIKERKLDSIIKMKKQLTKVECNKLIDNFGEKLVKNTLVAMDNKVGLEKKYKSVYSTCGSWCNLSINKK